MPSRYDTIGGIVLSYGKISMPGLWNLLELLRMLSRLLLVIKRTYSRVVNVWLSLLMMFSPNCLPPHGTWGAVNTLSNHGSCLRLLCVISQGHLVLKRTRFMTPVFEDYVLQIDFIIYLNCQMHWRSFVAKCSPNNFRAAILQYKLSITLCSGARQPTPSV